MVEYIEHREFGTLRVSRRKGTRSIRIGVAQNGEVRISLPYRVSLAAGLRFLEEKREWIIKHKKETVFLEDGAIIGRGTRLRVLPYDGSKLSIAHRGTEVFVYMPEESTADQVQQKLEKTAKKLLQKQAETYLPEHLDLIAHRYGFTYRSYKIKFLASRWGSCSTQNDVTLNSYLMQLPDSLIDYVIVHELAHTKHHNHSDSFWREVDRCLPHHKQLRHSLKKFPTAVIDVRYSQNFMA